MSHASWPVGHSLTPMADTERALQIADFAATPAWIIGGAMLWRRKALGYVSGLFYSFRPRLARCGIETYKSLTQALRYLTA